MAMQPTDGFSDEMKQKIRQLLNRQGLGVLATKDRDGHPYASLIAFAPSQDLRELYFVTPIATRKHANLKQDCRVALLIDNCVNQPADFHEAMAVTVLGRAGIVSDGQRADILSAYLQKHPYLRNFARSPSSALYVVKITGFTTVQQFQNVSELRSGHGPDTDT